MRFGLFVGVMGLEQGYSESELIWFHRRQVALAAMQQRLSELKNAPGVVSIQATETEAIVHFSERESPLQTRDAWAMHLFLSPVQVPEAPGDCGFFIWNQTQSAPCFIAATCSEAHNFVALLPEVQRWVDKPRIIQGEQWEMFVEDLAADAEPATLDIDDLVLHCFPIPR